MGEDNGTRWQSLPPFLMLLLLAVGSFWWIPWPLQGERPPQSAVGIQVEGVQQAAGRLWQDPFAVVQRYREGGPSVQAKGRDLSWLVGGRSGEMHRENALPPAGGDGLREPVRGRGGMAPQ